MTKWHGKDVPHGSVAENYHRYFVPAIGADAADRLIAVAAPQPGERVLDVACGTGVVARLATDRVGPSGSVTGLDVNPGMLAVARAATHPPRAVDWHEASAEKMPLPAASYDMVLCQMGLQFIPDRPAALAEMHRVLVPGGRLILNLPGPAPEPFVILADALARHVGPEASAFVRQVFSLHDTADISALLVGAGFRDVTVEAGTRLLALPPPADFLWQYLHSTPVAAGLGSLDDNHRDALEREVLTGWQPFVHDGALRFDARMITATGRK